MHVSLRPCPSYDPDLVQAAVDAAFDDLGGLAQHIRPGDRVFCKVNLLIPARWEQAITTHPEVVRAVVRAVKRVGGLPVVSDNPALAGPRPALKRSGIQAVIEQENLPTPDMSPTVVLKNPEAWAYREFQVSRAVAECDVLLGLPKLKSHAFTTLSVAQKNLFGLVPGTEKARWHFKAQDPSTFARLLADLYGAVRQHFGERMLHLCDGVLAMEGDGPGPSGTPRWLGALLASPDAIALDRVACELVGFDPESINTTRECARRGLGEGDLSRIDVRGEPLSTFDGVVFQSATTNTVDLYMGTRLTQSAMLRGLAVELPMLDPGRCVSCRQCGQICPAGAISFDETPTGRPNFDLDRCIRCYCCCEICPEGALRRGARPLLGRLLGV